MMDFEPTVYLGPAFRDGDAYIDVRPYQPLDGKLDPNMPVEIAMRSGEPRTDGLVMNFTLARLTVEKAKALIAGLQRVVDMAEQGAEHER